MRLEKLPQFTRGFAGSLSVRTRIIVLALIPVAGFVATGLTYISGEREVAEAFETADRAATLADASREFKIAIGSMRISVKDFVAGPKPRIVDDFDREMADALKSLSRITRSGAAMRGDTIVTLHNQLGGLKVNFDQLVAEQKTLGFDDSEGLRAKLRSAGNSIEQVINENLTWLDAAAAQKMMMSLLVMRHY
jgi:methyl-accepting chemotaxis protein